MLLSVITTRTESWQLALVKEIAERPGFCTVQLLSSPCPAEDDPAALDCKFVQPPASLPSQLLMPANAVPAADPSADMLLLPSTAPVAQVRDALLAAPMLLIPLLMLPHAAPSLLQPAPTQLLVRLRCCAACLPSQGCMPTWSQAMRAAGSMVSSLLTKSRASALILLGSGAYAPRRIDLLNSKETPATRLAKHR
jgi:hypothetical protein